MNEKVNMVSVGKIGMTKMPDNQIFIVLREISGILWKGIWNREHSIQWIQISENNAEKLDTIFGVLLALHRKSGKYCLFSRGLNNSTFYSWIVPDDSQSSVEWEDAKGCIGSELQICERRQGGLEAFRLDNYNIIWHMWTNPRTEWSEWQSLGGPSTSDFCVVNNAEGFPQVICVMPDGCIATRRHHNNGLWGDWNRIKEGNVNHIVAEQGADNRILLVALNFDGSVEVCRQDDSLDQWSKWERIPVNDITKIIAVRSCEGELRIIVYDKYGVTKSIYKTAYDNWEAVQTVAPSNTDLAAFLEWREYEIFRKS
ncbi:MAG: hypothetical protein MR308_05945 [Lachnospiraceae bacterium]|nr:hypothetical protein [Lachnospiraceae bacterium]